MRKIYATITKLFFHGKDENKIHMIAWGKVAIPCAKGGMGILSLNSLDFICKIKIM